MFGAAIGLVVGAVGVMVLVRFLVGVATMLVHRPGTVVGDAGIGAALQRAQDRHSRSFAAAVVDVGAAHPIRVAAVGCSPDDVFEIGSISKAITGMLLVDAEERGELHPDDTVGKHLPELAGRSIGAVTVSALTSHRSGLPRLGFGVRALLPLLGNLALGLNPYAGQDASFVIRASGRARLRGVGQQSYSNLGGALAGAVLARAAGSSYQELVRQRLAEPLGLSRTSARADAPRRRGFTRWGQWAQQWRLAGCAPAGGVTTTVNELATIAEALLRGDAPGTASLQSDECFWVRDAAADGEPLIWHNGETGGYAAYLGVRPESGRAVVITSNVADMRLITRAARELAAVE